MCLCLCLSPTLCVCSKTVNNTRIAVNITKYLFFVTIIQYVHEYLVSPWRSMVTTECFLRVYYCIYWVCLCVCANIIKFCFFSTVLHLYVFSPSSIFFLVLCVYVLENVSVHCCCKCYCCCCNCCYIQYVDVLKWKCKRTSYACTNKARMLLCSSFIYVSIISLFLFLSGSPIKLHCYKI